MTPAASAVVTHAAEGVTGRGRPEGELRRLIVLALTAHAELALRDVAAQTQIGYEDCRRVLSNMVRSNRVEIVGHQKRPHSRKWVALYALVAAPLDAPAQAAQPGAALQAVMGGWGGWGGCGGRVVETLTA